jgi:ABC-type bacteriocin/lantibiotic exporter with double-glycine peptidase domain
VDLARFLPKKRVPLEVQFEATDCGPTCLQMILAYHGREVRRDELRIATGCGRDGVSALAIVEAAREFGLDARGVRIEMEDLPKVDGPAVLHWGFDHFVVFESVGSDGTIHITDPALGRRDMPPEEVSGSFTGVALLFEPSQAFQREKLKKPLRSYLVKMLRSTPELVRVIALSLVLQICGLVLPFINGRIVDRVLPHNDHHMLAILGAGLVTIILFEFFSLLARSNLLNNLRTRLDVLMTASFMDHMLSLPYPFFQRRQSGDLMMRLNSNAHIREILSSGLLSAPIDALLVAVYLVLLIVMCPKLAFVAVGLVVLEGFVCLVVRKKQLALMTSSQQKQADAENCLMEILQGIETLKTTGCEARSLQRWANLYVDVENYSLRRGRMSAWSDAVLHVVDAGGPFLLLIVGTLDVMAGRLTLGTMMSALAFANGFIHPISSLIGTYNQFQMVGVYLDRIEDVVAAPREQTRTDLRAPGKLKGAIDVESVCFKYGPKSKMVVNDISLSIEAGKSIALVGASGSGKSTFAALLAGLYVPTSGTIAYDGVDLADVDLPSLRGQIGIVLQRPYVFGTTIRSNIAHDDASIPLSAIAEAAKAACIHDDIMAMPQGYDTPLTPGGGTISGGQRQRLALAAALLRKPSIMLLDEATSALDNVTERRVHENLETLGCTRIVIAHRLSTIRLADVILVMEDGVVVESGTHTELLAASGAYAKLVAAQESEEPRSARSSRGQRQQSARGSTVSSEPVGVPRVVSAHAPA